MTTDKSTDREARRDQAYVLILDLVREAGEIDDLTLMEQCATLFPDSGWWATTYSGFAAHLRCRGLLEGREASGRSYLKLRLRTPEKVHALLPQAEAFLLQLCGTVDAPGISERDVLTQTGEALKQSGEKAEVIEDTTNWALFSLITVQKKLQRAYFFKGAATGCRIFARPTEQAQTEQQLDWTIPLATELNHENTEEERTMPSNKEKKDSKRKKGISEKKSGQPKGPLILHDEAEREAPC